MDKKLLINEIEKIPEPFIEEIYDFVSYLKARIVREKSETAIASESSLKKGLARCQGRQCMAKFVRGDVVVAQRNT